MVPRRLPKHDFIGFYSFRGGKEKSFPPRKKGNMSEQKHFIFLDHKNRLLVLRERHALVQQKSMKEYLGVLDEGQSEIVDEIINAWSEDHFGFYLIKQEKENKIKELETDFLNKKGLIEKKYEIEKSKVNSAKKLSKEEKELKILDLDLNLREQIMPVENDFKKEVSVIKEAAIVYEKNSLTPKDAIVYKDWIFLNRKKVQELMTRKQNDLIEKIRSMNLPRLGFRDFRKTLLNQASLARRGVRVPGYGY